MAASELPPGDPTRDRCARVDSAALASFLDEHLGNAVLEGVFPGAAFVLVQDGRVVLSKGYGVADVTSGSPVQPDHTLFFVGSVSKLFTATAVMQLVDRGLLDLDTDVNRYLPDIRIDSNYAEPVTLRHLLTHTGGFDTRDIGIAATDRSEVQPIGRYLAEHLTPRVDPPGTAFLYSNQGMTLAGHIIENVTGQPFAEYMRDNVFQPLGMQDSGFDVPFDHKNLARSYASRGRAGRRAVPPAYFHNTPAVGLLTTASDMSRFLRAHLNGGEWDGNRILSPEASAAMQAPQFVVDPRLPGHGLGFHYGHRAGVRVLGHSGLVNLQASIVELVPGANAGFFVACNSAGCTRMEPVIDELMVQFFCGREAVPTGPTSATSIVPAAALAGVYRAHRHAQRNIEKARGLFDEYQLFARGDTLLVTRIGMPRRPWRLVPVSPDEWSLVQGDGNMVLVPKASGGHAMYFGARGLPREELVRLRFYETRSFFARMSLASTAGLASAIVILPILLVARRRRGSPGGRGVGLAAAVSGTVVCATLLMFLLGLQSVLGGAVESEFIYGIPRSVRALLWLPILTIAIALPLPAYAAVLWRRRLWTLSERLYYSSMILGVLALLLLLHYWNFIGLKF